MLNGYIIAKIFAQVERAEGLVPIKTFVQAKGKEPANDSLPQFLEQYCKSKRVGTFMKEQHTGKMISEWEKSVSEAPEKPEMVDMSPAISAAMAMKDEEELVSIAATLFFSLGKLNVCVKFSESYSDSRFLDIYTPQAPCCTKTRINLGQGVKNHSRYASSADRGPFGFWRGKGCQRP
jgi:hypothetical protein